MNQGKFYKSRGKRSAMKRPVAMLVSIALILVLSVGATVAYLLDQTSSVNNTFRPAAVTPDIHEDFKNNVKSNVFIENDGTVSAYIRVALIPTWEDDQGNPVGVSASLEDLAFTGFPGENWVKGSDGYYYYTSPVAAGGKTENLIDSATVETENGYRMNLQVLAQCIQADGVASDGTTKPVVDAWGTENGGSVTGVNGTTLQIG